METKAVLKSAQMSAQKARLVADLIRGQKAERALDMLHFSKKKAAQLIKKLLSSAIANAENNSGIDIDDLYVSKIFVDEGSRMKRFSARARGRSDRIIKRSCHITVMVAEDQGK